MDNKCLMFPALQELVFRRGVLLGLPENNFLQNSLEFFKLCTWAWRTLLILFSHFLLGGFHMWHSFNDPFRRHIRDFHIADKDYWYSWISSNILTLNCCIFQLLLIKLWSTTYKLWDGINFPSPFSFCDDSWRKPWAPGRCKDTL